MSVLHRGSTVLLALVLLPSVLLLGAKSSVNTFAQDAPAAEPRLKLYGPAERGIELYNRGQFDEAAKELREAVRKREDNAEAWHYLGLALKGAGKDRAALEALERAVSLRLGGFNREFNEQAKNNVEISKQESDTRRSRFAARTKEAIESVEKYLELNPEDAGLWREQLETWRLFEKLAGDPKFESTPFRLSQLATKAVLLRKPEPGFTERARQNQTSGVIRLRLLLGADGAIQDVFVIKSLPDGLTEKALAAARRVKFTPATIEGRPVAQLVMLEYNFNVY